MDIHKPKPWHGVREFLKEYLIIVIGVLTALGAEQVAENLHWREKVHEAKTSVHQELTMATVLADERIARRDCSDAYLADLAAAITASPPAWRPPTSNYCGLKEAGYVTVGNRPWPTEVWRSIEAEGVVSHFDNRYRASAPLLFHFIDGIQTMSRQEDSIAPELEPLAGPLVMTPDSKIHFLTTIAKLRWMNRMLAFFGGQVKGGIANLGETPSAAELKAMQAQVPSLLRAPGVIQNPSTAP
jgi:hypothetical protein